MKSIQLYSDQKHKKFQLVFYKIHRSDILFFANSIRFRYTADVGCKDKIVLWKNLKDWREDIRQRGLKLVATNGCFDILHAGHVQYLENAKKEGNILLVGLDSDESVRAIKGPSRPVNKEADRATVLAGLESVDAVCIFEGIGAMSFLQNVLPDIYVKGGDYTLETIVQSERRFMESKGIKIVLSPGVPGLSTTATLLKLNKN